MAETGGLVDGQTEHLQEQRTVNLSLHKLKRFHLLPRSFPGDQPMKVMCRAASCCLGMLYAACLPAQSAGPDDRVTSDPQAVNSTPTSESRLIPIDDLFFTQTISSGSWSPDGEEIAFSTNISGRTNLWKVSAAGGWPVQLVQSDNRQVSASWSPDGKWIVFQQDFGGNELWDIFAVPSDGGPVINLTQTPDIREQSPRWSPDGKTIVFRYKPKQGSTYDLALLDFSSHRVSHLTHEDSTDHNWDPAAWSPDGKTLYANRADVGHTDGDVYEIDVVSGKTANLTPHQGKILNVASSLSPDGKTLLITSNAQGGYQNVALLEVMTQKWIWVTHTKWEDQSGDFSPTGKTFTYTLNADGLTDPYLVSLPSMRAEKLPLEPGLNEPAGTINAFSPSGDRLLLSHQSSVRPLDLLVYDTTSTKARQLTRAAIASLASAPMPQSQIVHYRSFDGKTISALLWIPFNLKRDGSNPALVLPHGGPTSQVLDSWSPRVAALVSRGYICIAPNVRGSSGYGMDFQQANVHDLGGGDLQDEVYAAKFVQATGYVDARRIGITGGSYGGFMTLMAIGKTPDIWAAGVALYGITNWMSMLQHSDPLLQQYVKSLLGDPIIDRATYDAASPITYIHAVQAPLLILQGDSDPRVPKEEAVQVVELLKKDGKTVDAHYYPNEGHGFSKREDQIDSIRRTLDWFDKYLNRQ
jgi:dipeptidyl aminopeptidase/acylaminoacyl peptidase